VKIGINALWLIPGGVGGTESYLRNLIRVMEQIDRDDEFIVFTNAENAGTFGLSAPNFREVRCPVRAVSRPKRILWEQVALPLQVARERLDVLHSGGYTAPLSTNAASVVTIHDLNYHYFPEDWSRAALIANQLLIPRVARRSTRIITVSHCSKRAMIEVLQIDPSKIDVIYHGVDGNLAPPIDGEERAVRERYRLGGPFILSVTASHPHKNLDGLLRAYDRACQEWPSSPPLVIVGIKGRHQEALESMLQQRSTRGRVVLTGWIDAPTLAALYRAAHLFVFPSKYEGFGFPVLEAMLAGVPVVSSNATSLPEVTGDAAVSIDPSDDAQLAGAMRKTFEDEALRRDLVARGRAQAAHFTWRRAAEATLDSYRSAALRRRFATTPPEIPHNV
jgi:glycosyltransferase involved in cell wall biosynthesis